MINGDLPYIFKSLLSLIDIDDTSLCARLGITIHDLENIMYGSYTINYQNLLKIKLRLISTIKHHITGLDG